MEQRIKRDGITVWAENGVITHAWVSDGGKAWFLSDEEKKLAPEVLHAKIKEAWKNGDGVWRCSECGKEMKKEEVAGWPLFAGVACSECWLKHLDHLKEQRRLGQVCRMCNRPYDDCCC